MSQLDHWHPVALSRDLRSTPVPVKLAGRELAVYRTQSGQAVCLDDVCPHRRMRLSLGEVIGDKLQCKYHGWTFDCKGQGESPGTPKLHACAEAFEVRENFGAVWVRQHGAKTAFPEFEITGYYSMGAICHRVKAPLELVVDNFTEIEHTPTTHGVFGYPLERMHEVRVTFEATDTTVRTINIGPTKPLPWYLRKLVGVRNDDMFIDDWTTHFSPVYTCFNHEWGAEDGSRRGRVGWRLFIVWTPITDIETQITTFSFARSDYPGPYGGLRIFKWLMQRLLDVEIRKDVAIIEGLASHNTSLIGMKLSRFDRPLGLNRERIASVYRGESPNRLSLAG